MRTKNGKQQQQKIYVRNPSLKSLLMLPSLVTYKSKTSQNNDIALFEARFTKKRKKQEVILLMEYTFKAWNIQTPISVYDDTSKLAKALMRECDRDDVKVICNYDKLAGLFCNIYDNNGNCLKTLLCKIIPVNLTEFED